MAEKYIIIDTDSSKKQYLNSFLSLEQDDLIEYIETEGRSFEDILKSYLKFITSDENCRVTHYYRIIIFTEAKFNISSSQFDGVEILKHFLLTEELSTDFEEEKIYTFQSASILLLHWMPIEYYISDRTDNIMAFFQNVFRARLPILKESILDKWKNTDLVETESFINANRRLIVFNENEEDKGEHEYRNKLGATILKDEISKKENVGNGNLGVYKLPLWLKKHRFLEKNKLSRLEVLPNEVIDSFFGVFNPAQIHILWVDDESEIWEEALKKVIEKTKIKEDYILTRITNIEEALEISDFNKYDLILLDLRIDKNKDSSEKDLSSLSGFQVLTKIREINKHIPVIFFTASIKVNIHKLALQKGADAYLTKGISSLDEIVLVFNLEYARCLLNKDLLINSEKIYFTNYHTRSNSQIKGLELEKIKNSLETLAENIYYFLKVGCVSQSLYLSILTILVYLMEKKFCLNKSKREGNQYTRPAFDAFFNSNNKNINIFSAIKKSRNDAIHKWAMNEMGNDFEELLKVTKTLVANFRTKYIFNNR